MADKIEIPDKITGGQHTAAEWNLFKSMLNTLADEMIGRVTEETLSDIISGKVDAIGAYLQDATATTPAVGDRSGKIATTEYVQLTADQMELIASSYTPISLPTLLINTNTTSSVNWVKWQYRKEDKLATCTVLPTAGGTEMVFYGMEDGDTGLIHLVRGTGAADTPVRFPNSNLSKNFIVEPGEGVVTRIAVQRRGNAYMVSSEPFGVLKMTLPKVTQFANGTPTTGAIPLSWAATPNATGYDFYVKQGDTNGWTGGGFGTPVMSVAAGTTSTTLTKSTTGGQPLNPGINYYVSIFAVDSSGTRYQSEPNTIGPIMMPS